MSLALKKEIDMYGQEVLQNPPYLFKKKIVKKVSNDKMLVRSDSRDGIMSSRTLQWEKPNF